MLTNQLICSGKTKTGRPCKNKGSYKSIYEDTRSFCLTHVQKSDELCSICMNNLFDIDMLSCGHMFHKRCISRWTKYKSTCPICRCIVYKDNDVVRLTRMSDLASIRMDIQFT